MILDRIMAHKREELAAQRRATPLADLKSSIPDLPPAVDLAEALSRCGVSLIAEVKRASPSKGLLCPSFDPVELAATYATNGAAAISVLTDVKFFQGKLGYIDRVRSFISDLPLPIPILRKDFIFDPYQLYQSRSAGADAVLLIVAVLSDDELADLLELTHELGMMALVEVHDEEELERALRVEPRVVGVNNRNLEDFSVDLATFDRLRPLIPSEVVAVAESGVQAAGDVIRLAEMGADAVLVGEALVTATDVGAKVREFALAGRMGVQMQ